MFSHYLDQIMYVITINVKLTAYYGEEQGKSW